MARRTIRELVRNSVAKADTGGREELAGYSPRPIRARISEATVTKVPSPDGAARLSPRAELTSEA